LSGSANGKPNSNEFILEADWVPFGKADSWAATVGQSEAWRAIHDLYAVQWRHIEL
jgi:hypothetical protein